MINRDIKVDGNILPSMINATKSIPPEFCFHKDYRKMPPFRIAYLSLQKLFKKFDSLLKEHSRLMDLIQKVDVRKYKEIDFTPLSDSIIGLLNGINSYIEDCYHIFRITTPFNSKTAKIKEKFVPRWLARAKHPTYEMFFESIKLYKEEISQYINPEKHEHHRIEVIVGQLDNKYTIGYTMHYIDESPENKGEVFDMNSIKTIITEIGYHFYKVYEIADKFTQNLLKALEYFHSINMEIHCCPIKI